MGKIIFTSNDLVFSKMIRKFTKSDVSHVAFEYSSNSISHSTFKYGVSNYPKDAFKYNSILHVFEIPDKNYEIARNVYRKHRTKNYGYFDILYSAISIILKRIIKFKNPIQDGFICSEYVALYIDACMGTKLYSSSYPPTPEDLLKWCQENLSKTSY